MGTTESSPRSDPYRLSFELIPSPCWGVGLGERVGARQWQDCARQLAADQGGRCAVCGCAGPLMAHEHWRYDDATHVRTLARLEAICQSCWQVKHAGLAAILAREGKLWYDEVIAHFCRVNVCDEATYHEELADARTRWVARSQHEWRTDFGRYAPPARP